MVLIGSSGMVVDALTTLGAVHVKQNVHAVFFGEINGSVNPFEGVWF